MNNDAKALFKKISFILFLWIIAAGCSTGSVSPPPPATLVSISISPANPSIAPGTTIQLAAQGTFSNGSKQYLTSSVTWASSNTAIATVAPGGLVSAVSSTTGTVTISASYSGISGSTILTSSELLSIDVTPANQTIASGTTIQYAAKGTLANTLPQNISAFVSWDSSDPNIADITPSSGLATAGTATGTATISALFSGITGSTNLTSADVASISVAPLDATIILGTTQQYLATGALAVSGSPTQNLTPWATWTSSSPSVATFNNLAGPKGLATSQGTGTTFITAAYALVTSNTATLVVNPATLLTIEVTPASSVSVPLGKTQQFTATGTYSNNTTQDLTSVATWFSSNELVSTVSNTVGSKGLATTLAEGSTAISAQFSGVTSNSATLTVTAPELVSIAVFPHNPVVVISGTTTTQQFQAVGLFTDNSLVDLTTSVSWNSSNSFVARINIPGSPGLASLVSNGTTTITATSGSISGSTLLTVTF